MKKYIKVGDNSEYVFREAAEWCHDHISPETKCEWVVYTFANDDAQRLTSKFWESYQYSFYMLERLMSLKYAEGDGWIIWKLRLKSEYLQTGKTAEWAIYYDIKDDSHAIMLQLAKFGAQT